MAWCLVKQRGNFAFVSQLRNFVTNLSYRRKNSQM